MIWFANEFELAVCSRKIPFFRSLQVIMLKAKLKLKVVMKADASGMKTLPDYWDTGQRYLLKQLKLLRELRRFEPLVTSLHEPRAPSLPLVTSREYTANHSAIISTTHSIQPYVSHIHSMHAKLKPELELMRMRPSSCAIDIASMQYELEVRCQNGVEIKR